MQQKKFSQLLSSATAISTTLEFKLQQIDEFAQAAATLGATITSSVDAIAASLQAIAANPPPLSKTDSDALHKLKTNLAKITQELHRELEKPCMQHKKEVDALQVKLTTKILPEILKPCVFNLDPIRRQVSKAQELSQKANLGLDKSLIIIAKCQTKLSKAQTEVQRLNFANELEGTTRDVSKVSNELKAINQLLASTPSNQEVYQQQFLPLYTGLEGLRLESEALTSSQHKPKLV